MKDSKRLTHILDQAQQTASPITSSAFFKFYLLEDGIIQKAVNHYLLQTNREDALIDSLYELDREAKATIYNGYLLTDSLYKAVEFGSVRAEKFKQVVMTEAHVLEGILSSLPNSKTRLGILQLATTTQDLLVTLPIPRMPMNPDRNVKAASLANKKEILDFVSKQFGISWTEQVLRMLIEQDGVVLIVREEGQLTGFCCYRKQNADRAVFGPMGVRKNCRNSGYGRSLVLAALHDVNKKGFREFLISEAGPIEFYERMFPLKLHTKEKG